MEPADVSSNGVQLDGHNGDVEARSALDNALISLVVIYGLSLTCTDSGPSQDLKSHSGQR
jgi:hypothetical protein